MELIQITRDNLAQEHICCAISNNKDVQVQSKKIWLKDRLEEGLVFLKCNVRGKGFIEYIPAEYAWVPIRADRYMYIDCLWVAGQLKGHGYSNLLLDACISDSQAKGKKGLAVISSKKKMGFLADPKYLQHKGFQLADTADPYFELWILPFGQETGKPHFQNCVKEKHTMADGFTLYYTSQCPYTAKYVPLLAKMAEVRGVQCKIIHLQSRDEAQKAPTPFTTFSLYDNGEFVTHEILSEKKFDKILTARGYTGIKESKTARP